MSAAANVVTDTIENSPKTTADIMARMFEIRAERAEIKERDSELFQEFERLSEQMIARMQEQGTKRVSSAHGTAILSTTLVAGVDDWDAALDYMRENDALHLLQRRIATGAYRELIAAGQEVPGVRQVEKVDINLRSA